MTRYAVVTARKPIREKEVQRVKVAPVLVEPDLTETGPGQTLEEMQVAAPLEAFRVVEAPVAEEVEEDKL